MNTCVRLVRIVLYVLIQSPRGRHGENGTVTRMRVERVAINRVRGLFCGEQEDSAGIGRG